uniref:Uncharacterized protein LOC111112208 n=1 Tax=Crassostrea virginica TaxID=6565 RepID=A0A8B8BR28_CRAVI|nr:uncharacterized protein LOC111112208 [Crassostrea virginica]XP_022305315.1 uncharacterized protein LOC111112208 [Crassostrea virginica]
MTGKCDGNCAAGWNGSFCLEECVGSYGENCQHPCSHKCLELKCDGVSGHCLTGCKNGTHGEICDIANKTEAETSVNQRISSESFFPWVIGVGLALSIMFIVGVTICIWRVKSKKLALSCTFIKCAESDLYTNADVPDNTPTLPRTHPYIRKGPKFLFKHNSSLVD